MAAFGPLVLEEPRQVAQVFQRLLVALKNEAQSEQRPRAGGGAGGDVRLCYLGCNAHGLSSCQRLYAAAVRPVRIYAASTGERSPHSLVQLCVPGTAASSSLRKFLASNLRLWNLAKPDGEQPRKGSHVEFSSGE
eukprot:289825-Amphidinium_carterae.1